LWSVIVAAATASSFSFFLLYSLFIFYFFIFVSPESCHRVSTKKVSQENLMINAINKTSNLYFYPLTGVLNSVGF